MSAERSDERGMLSAIIDEFPEGRRITGLLDGGEFDLAWDWLFHLTDELRPALSDGLRNDILEFFEGTAEFHDKYRDEVRRHLEMLPRRHSSPSLTS